MADGYLYDFNIYATGERATGESGTYTVWLHQRQTPPVALWQLLLIIAGDLRLWHNPDHCKNFPIRDQWGSKEVSARRVCRLGTSLQPRGRTTKLSMWPVHWPVWHPSPLWKGNIRMALDLKLTVTALYNQCMGGATSYHVRLKCMEKHILVSLWCVCDNSVRTGAHMDHKHFHLMLAEQLHVEKVCQMSQKMSTSTRMWYSNDLFHKPPLCIPISIA